MIVNDVIDMIIRYNQVREYSEIISKYSELSIENPSFFLTKEYFGIQKEGMLKNIRISLGKTKIQIDEFVEFSDITELGTKITNGYWVGVFYCSMDSWIFDWYTTIKEAEKAFEREKVEYFTVQKILFHTENGILMAEHA